MHTINVKGTPNPKDPKMVKITIIFHQTGYCRSKKVLSITGLLSEWDQHKQCFKIKNSEYQVKNNMISELILKYIKVADEWESRGDSWSPAQWATCFDNKAEQAYEKKVKVKSVSQMIAHLIEVFESKERFKNGKIVSSFSNVREYEFLLSSLQEFTKAKYSKGFSLYYFKDITETFLNDYALFLQVRGAKNGNKGAVRHRLKKLRAVCNYALKDSIPGANLKAFACVELKMKNTKFIPKTIPYPIIQKIEHLDKSKFSRLEQFYLDLFLFSFYAGGMANIDVAYLNRGSIKEDAIEYERIKVCKDAKPPLVDKAKILIEKYKGTGFDDYVFPIFTAKHITEQQKRDRLERLYSKVNATLEKVRKKIRYEDKITWYTARGTYITKMIDAGFNSATVAEAAGNSEEIIFKHYYKITNQKENLKKMNSVLR